MKSSIKKNCQWIVGSFTTAAILVALTACTPSSRVGAPVPEHVIPDGLKDCQFYTITTSGGSLLRIVRCPNSSTSVTKTGKNPVYTATIDSPAPAASESGYLSAEDQIRKSREAMIAKIDAEIKRLELRAAELRAEASK